MKLLTLKTGSDGSPGVRLSSGEILDLNAYSPSPSSDFASVSRILAGGPDALSWMQAARADAETIDAEDRQRCRDRAAIVSASHELLAPVPQPSLILAAGLAYRSHLAEMSNTPPPAHPTGFLKAPSSISASGAIVEIPEGVDMLDFEGEIAVVFGRACHRVTAAQALDYVAGYTLANDLSARDWVEAVWKATSPWEARLTWEVNLMGKQFPGFTALGPVIATADEIPDPAEITLTTRVNGEVMQHAPVSDLIFSIPEMIAHFARWYVFSPGDVLLTGTPAGVGVGRQPQKFLRRGDVVEVDAPQIGRLTTLIG